MSSNAEFPHDINVDIEAPELVERGSWLRWCPTSMGALREAEKRILSYVRTKWTGRYVDIGPCMNEDACKVWTLSFNEKSKKTPLVLVHGFAAGVALWSLNFDSLAAHRPVHALDLLGFGRSSRPTFSRDSIEAENQLVKSIEDWRKEMLLEKMILLGHSMGGFLAASYALKYPERVEHLILADPWGFAAMPMTQELYKSIPMWAKAVATLIQPFNPLAGVRAAGPWGPGLVKRARPDIAQKFMPLVGEDIDIIPNYIYHCNAQNPSGEGAFHAMSKRFGWAKNPMLPRVFDLDPNVPITCIYGSRSWISSDSGERIIEERGSSSVRLERIADAGHHVYADRAESFNQLVNEVCQLVDEGKEGKGKAQDGGGSAARVKVGA